MAIRFEKQCKVCQLILEQNADEPDKSPLFKRIGRSRSNRKNGEALTSIHQDYTDSFSLHTLRAHTKWHQATTLEKLVSAKTNHALAMKKSRVLQEVVGAHVTHDIVRDKIIQDGYEGLQHGTLRVGMKDVTAALKQQADIEAKQKDQALDLMKLLSAAQSGTEDLLDDGREIVLPEGTGFLPEGAQALIDEAR